MEEINVEMCPYIFNGNYCDTCQDYCENISDCEYKQLKQLEEKYNKMVEISKENLIKYEDLRIDNQKLIMEIENLKSQIDFEAQKQAILLQENEELKEATDGLLKIQYALADSCNKKETALEEIKKLTVIGINASQCNCGLRALADDILHIITGAIGE